jgi:hypothetical protein
LFLDVFSLDVFSLDTSADAAIIVSASEAWGSIDTLQYRLSATQSGRRARHLVGSFEHFQPSLARAGKISAKRTERTLPRVAR